MIRACLATLLLGATAMAGPGCYVHVRDAHRHEVRVYREHECHAGCYHRRPVVVVTHRSHPGHHHHHHHGCGHW